MEEMEEESCVSPEEDKSGYHIVNGMEYRDRNVKRGQNMGEEISDTRLLIPSLLDFFSSERIYLRKLFFLRLNSIRKGTIGKEIRFLRE